MVNTRIYEFALIPVYSSRITFDDSYIQDIKAAGSLHSRYIKSTVIKSTFYESDLYKHLLTWLFGMLFFLIPRFNIQDKFYRRMNEVTPSFGLIIIIL